MGKMDGRTRVHLAAFASLLCEICSKLSQAILRGEAQGNEYRNHKERPKREETVATRPRSAPPNVDPDRDG